MQTHYISYYCTAFHPNLSNSLKVALIYGGPLNKKSKENMCES